MPPLSKFREDRLRGAFADEMGPECFVEDDSSVFLCKKNQVGLALEIQGVDYSCADKEDLDSITEGWGQAIHMLPPNFEVKKYRRKLDNPPIPRGQYDHPEVERLAGGRADQVARSSADLYTVELHLIILLDIFRGKANGKPVVPASALEAACKQLRAAVASFIQHVRSDVSVRVLDKKETRNFLRTLVNFSPDKYAPRDVDDDCSIDYEICETHVNLIWEDERHREPYLRLDHEIYAKVMALKLPPKETEANMMAKLDAVPCNFILASTWRGEEVEKTISAAEWRRGRFWSQGRREGSKGSSNERYNEEKMSLGDQMNTLLRDIEKEQVRMGHYSLYCILWGEETRVQAGVVEIGKAFKRKGGVFAADHDNQLDGYLATLPGWIGTDHRVQRISVGNYAEMSTTIFSLDCGDAFNHHLKAEYMTMYESIPPEGLFGHTFYCFSPGSKGPHKGVQHCLFVGSTGSGKTVHLKQLATNAQKYVDPETGKPPFTVFFDKKQSFRGLTERFGGSVVSFADRTVKANPLLMPGTDDNIQWQSQWLAILIESGNPNLKKLPSEDKENIHKALCYLAKQPDRMRNLSVLQGMLREELKEALASWCGSGQYGWVFDNAEDTLGMADWQSFEFGGMDQYKDVIDPLFYYVMHRIRQVVFDPKQRRRLKFLVLDEAYFLVKHPAIKAYVEEAVRTYREPNGLMVFSTQDIGDLPAELLDCFPTWFLFRHNRVEHERYMKVGQFTKTEIKALEGLRGAGRFILATPEGARELWLNLSPEEAEAYI